MSETRLSFVVPARNEETLIGEVLEAILASVARASGLSRKDLRLPDTSFEVIVTDDASEDGTAAIVRAFADDVGVRLVSCVGGTGAAARNAGVAASAGRVLCFVDADTIVPENAVDRIVELHEDEGRCLVLYRLASREPGFRAWLWWTFWGLARRLPLARAKSMPAFMSCDRAHFESYGPFDERWAIAEEWPLTRAAYWYHRERFLYDRSLTARTSSRRMELQPFGYLRTFLKWVSVVLVAWARRTDAYDRIRHETGIDDARKDDDHHGYRLRALRRLRIVRELAERAYFLLCLALGWLLRSGRYSKARIVSQDGELQVRKYRLFYAPLLVRMGGLLVRILDTGVRVLPQRDWEERERRVYRSLYSTSIRIDVDGMLVLPCLAGETLAILLEDPELEESVRKTAIERAVVALAEFHRLGFTHGDAMAENVLVDLDAGVAHWFDFETTHDPSRPMAWRRADDVRALLVTCLVRTTAERRAEILGLILDVYADEGVTRLLAARFASVWRRPLTLHLAQAALSLQCYREIAGLLRERLDGGVRG
jgi:glycosyltransferase involved in cell wall biosynthesis